MSSRNVLPFPWQSFQRDGSEGVGFYASPFDLWIYGDGTLQKPVTNAADPPKSRLPQVSRKRCPDHP
ncbi:hypothetical protein T02_13276 [Trichinella nativa]|uniref:Uncharacterized protein n=1 Tax=Trichinella nativa TaxID=6335 RepID=A0A0V1KPW0_9BILA|nr:hypothetical protein T02_13276 [Trichinella nativa]